jgi:F-type H+-transporting ATPase subunit gamma
MAANLKEVRERIKSVISTQQITKAMKMVSAAKLRRAQQAIVEMRPYANRLNVMLGNVLANTQGDFNSEFGKQREINRVCLVLVTSSKGLCGAFNTNIIKALTARINGKYAEHYAAGKVTVVCIGKRGYDFARKHFAKATIVNDYVDLFSDLTFEATEKVASGIMDKFAGGDFDVVEVAYGQFKNAGTQFPMVDTYLPVLSTHEPKDGKKQSRADYLFEPDQVTLLDHLIPSILRTTFFKYLLDTHASEHGARMTAMDKATENAEDLLKELKISYNKARQEAITRELSEIVGGAAALESA